MATFDTVTKKWTETVRTESGWEIHLASLSYEDPNWATTDRGWLFDSNDQTIGHYLDYGPDHFRSSHEWCRGECTCRESQPGNIHAVRFHRSKKDRRNTYGTESRYFETCEQARKWIERS